MRRRILGSTYISLGRLLVGAVVLTLCMTTGAFAQARGGTIDTGTTIMVRTNEFVDSENNDGRVFRGTVQQNVLDRNGDIAIPRGSEAELVVRDISSRQVELDLNSIIVAGEHFNVAAGGALVNSSRRQIQTRGRNVFVPNNVVLTFRLEQPLRMGYDENRRYKPGYDDDYNSPAFRAGMAAGRADAERNLRRDPRLSRWTSAQDRRDYEVGYNRAYDNRMGSGQTPPPIASARIRIGGDNNVSWQSPVPSRIYVQVDNNPIQLFAEGASGNQVASWIAPGHVLRFHVA